MRRGSFSGWTEYWDLIIILSKRDISVRYKQTVLGFLWALIRPLMTMLIFLFFYKKAAKIQDISGYPIQLILFSGLIFWFYFTNSLQAVSNSILINSNLVTKVYFPRIILCISAFAVPFLDFVVGFIFYAILSMYFGYGLDFHWPILFLSLLLISLLSLGLGMLFAAWSVKYRDLQQLLPLIIQYGLFVSPILFTTQTLMSQVQGLDWYAFVNPLLGLVELFRYGLISNYSLFDYSLLWTSIPGIFMFLGLGLFIFKAKEDSFVDYI